MSDKQREVAELRQRMAEIDRELLQTLEARARISRDIYSLLEGDTAAVDVGEREWLAQLQGLATGDLPEESLYAIFRQIRAQARALEQPVRVAYIGPEGGFGHQMARGYFGGRATLVETPSAAAALDEVSRGRAVYAVFPFESSVDGLVQPSITALANTDLVLVAERSLPATYGLMGRAKSLGQVERVVATATAHAGCQMFLARELPGVAVVDVRSPARAAALCLEGPATAALFPECYGAEVGLDLLVSNVGDSPDQQFRYGVASPRPAIRTGNDTTCLLFSVDDTPGALFEVLRHFAERGINMRKLQSRPVNGGSWDYVFYVEVSGHITDRPVVLALEGVKRNTKYLKILGCFPDEP